MTDEFDEEGMIIHTGNEVSFSTTIKELLETILLYRENLPGAFEGRDYRGLCKLLSNEIELQCRYQEDTIKEYNSRNVGILEVIDNVTPFKPSEK